MNERDEWGAPSTEASSAALRVLLYSDDVRTREQVRQAVGGRIARDLPAVEWHEVATAAAAISAVETGGFHLLVLDGETGKVGGMGLCRQLKDEIFRCPPVLLLVGRAQDAWLASWTDADAVVARPLDPIVLHEAVAGLLRGAPA